MKKRIYQKKLYYTIFISFTCFFIIISGLFIKILSTNIEHQINQAYNQKILSNSDSLKFAFSVISNSIYPIKNDINIENWANSESESNYYLCMKNIQDKLKKSNINLNKIDFTIALTLSDTKSHIITNESTINKQIYFTSNYSGLNINDWNHILDNNETKFIIPIYDDSNKLIKLTYIDKEKISNSKKAIFLITINTENLFYNNSDFFIFDNESLVALSHKDDEFILTSSKYIEKIKEMRPLPLQSVFNITINKQPLYIIRTGFYNLNIAYLYNNETQSLATLFLSIIIPFLISGILIFLIQQIIFKYLYKPIEDTLKSINNKDISTNNKIDEFKLLQTHISKYEIINNELEKVVFENNKLTTQKYFKELIYGVPSNIKCPLLENEIYANYAVSYIEIIPQNKNYETNDWFNQLQKNKIFIFTEQEKKLRNIFSINYYYNSIVLIIESNTKEELISLLTNIKNIDKQSNNLFICVSDIQKNINSISNSFKQVLKIADYRYSNNKEQILTSQVLGQQSINNFYYPLALENKLIHSISISDINAINIYDDLINENIINGKLSNNSRRNFTYALIGTLLRSLQETRLPDYNEMKNKFDFPYLYTHWNNNNIFETIREFFCEIVNNKEINNENSNTNNDQIIKMKKYIFDHYNEDIMLIDIAEHCDLTINYCSYLFKKLENTNFKTFLNEYRITKSCSILENNPDIKILDLSNTVGFNSSNSFIRVFKAQIGMSPKAYSKMLKEKS